MSEYDVHQAPGAGGSEPRVRLREPEDLVELIPYVLGFHPRSSLVLAGFAAGSAADRTQQRLQLAARLDLADYDAATFDESRDGATAASGTDVAAGVAAHTAAIVAQAGATHVRGVVFAGPGNSPESIVRAMRCAGLACEQAGLSMGDWLVCSDEPQARPVTGVAADATYAGMVARADRSALVALLDSCPARERERLRPDLGRAEIARARAAREGRLSEHRDEATRALLAAGRALFIADDAQVVRFGAALADGDVCDRCWSAMESGQLDGANLWRELARRLPDPWSAPALFLFAWNRWRRGDGALAGIAARRALDSDPNFRPAHLLESALAHGVNPFALPRLRSA